MMERFNFTGKFFITWCIMKIDDIMFMLRAISASKFSQCVSVNVGAALRNELPSKVNMSLADNVMAQIKNENIKPEPAKIKEISLPSFKIAFKKFSFGIAQVALAASVAAITIIGWQTYNADEGITGDKTTAPLGSVEGVNLASYQTAHNDKTLKFNDKSNQTRNQNEDKVNSAELKKQQSLEVERINNYIRGYVFDTASN